MQAKNVRKKRKLGSYPFGSVIFSITLAIFVMGLFSLFFTLAKSLTSAIQKNVEIQVYLNKQITQTEIDFLSRTIAESPYVRREENYPQVKFVSKEEAASQFMEATGEDFTSFVGDNPLRDALVVNIAASYQRVDSLKNVKVSLEKTRGVFEVTYEKTLVESISKNLTKLALVLGGFTLILLLVVVILINNTIKLALFSQRFLIRSMQLVGATDRFIRRPFLIRAVFYGFIAGLFADVLLYGLIMYGNQQIENLKELQNQTDILILFAALLVLGTLVGHFSTFRAVKKYLKLSLDELY
ncbi:MAG: ABC transporter permease [Cytophagales bacterium]|nr:ABC transporter permease [Cytophagales bacterium]